jgi:protein SCO1/2
MDMKHQSFQFNTSIAFPICVLTLIFIILLVGNSYEKHLSYLSAQTEVAVLPAPRQIEPFNLVTVNHAPFSQENLLNHWTFLFFSYTRCGENCVKTLSSLNRTYNALSTKFPSLQMVVVSLDPKHDSPEILKSYLQSFNEKFIGATGAKDQLIKLQKQLGMLAQQLPLDNAKTYRTNSILLINPQGQLQALLSPNLNFTQMSEQVQRIMK